MLSMLALYPPMLSRSTRYAVHAALVPSLERSRNVRPCVPLHTHTSSSGKIRRCCVDRLNPQPKADPRGFYVGGKELWFKQPAATPRRGRDARNIACKP